MHSIKRLTAAQIMTVLMIVVGFYMGQGFGLRGPVTADAISLAALITGGAAIMCFGIVAFIMDTGAFVSIAAAIFAAAWAAVIAATVTVMPTGPYVCISALVVFFAIGDEKLKLKYSWVLGTLALEAAGIYGTLKVRGIEGASIAVGSIALLILATTLGETRALRTDNTGAPTTE